MGGGKGGFPRLHSPGKCCVSGAAMNPSPKARAVLVVGVGSGWSRLSRVSEISLGRALEQRAPSSGVAKSRSKYWVKDKLGVKQG